MFKQNLQTFQFVYYWINNFDFWNCCGGFPLESYNFLSMAVSGIAFFIVRGLTAIYERCQLEEITITQLLELSGHLSTRIKLRL